MSVLQYTLYALEEAYSGNTRITCYKDGKTVDEYIVSDWVLGEHLDCLKNEGYKPLLYL